jgi:hypothetical protein
VVFLASNNANVGVQAEAVQADEQRLDPNNPMEKELMSQIDQIKTRVASRTAKPADPVQFEAARAPKKKAAVEKADAPAGGEIDFADEPPFADDLPF